MNDQLLEQSFSEVIAAAEKDIDAISPHQIWCRLQEAIPSDQEHSTLSLRIRLELFAFCASSRQWTSTRVLHQEEYYCLFEEEDTCHFALIPEAVDYFRDRAAKCVSPIMRIRYADLAWDLAGRIKGTRRDVDMARAVVDVTLDIAPVSDHDIELINLYARALALAPACKDIARLNAVADAILALERSSATDNLLGTWGFSFDLLWEQKKLENWRSIQDQLVADLEMRFARICDSGVTKRFDPNNADWAARRLLQAYKSRSCSEDILRVLLKFEEAVKSFATTVPSYLSLHWFQKIHAYFAKFGFTKEAESLRVHLARVARQLTKELMPHEHVFTFKWADLYPLVSHLCVADLDESLTRIGKYFIPRKSDGLKALRWQREQFPLSSLSGESYHAKEGHPVANVGAFDTDVR